MNFRLNAVSLATIGAVVIGYQSLSAPSINSPDGNWGLKREPPTNPQVDARHVLLLRRAEGSAVEIRRVEGDGRPAVWSPDSTRIAITDRWASDRSDVLIYSVFHPRIEISRAKLFPKTAIPPGELGGHCYLEAVRWVSRQRLHMRISGHRDEYPANGFEYDFIFDFASGRFNKLPKRKPNRADALDAGRTVCFHAESHWPGASDPRRSPLKATRQGYGNWYVQGYESQFCRDR